MLAKCVLLLLCYHLLLHVGGAVNEFTPTVYPAKIFPSSQCGQYSTFNEQLKEVLQQIQQEIPNNTICTCKSILDNYPSAPSGYYNITTTNGSTVLVYCDMEGINCGGEGGWTRVAYVNMTQPGATCPQGLIQTSYNNCSNTQPGATCPQGLNQTSYNNKTICDNNTIICDNNKTLCSKNGNVCTSTVFPTLVEYSKVCGQVRGYQYHRAWAFYIYNTEKLANFTIDDVYVEGVSITYGNTPRKHIWTYAAGFQDTVQYSGLSDCPCKNNSTTDTPPFVGNDYYCESGVHFCCFAPDFKYNDPLWDGQQCGGGEPPCCTHPNMPWFIKTLDETTTEDIELRVCKHFIGDIPLELIELFVQ